jgi:hypothetical protein
LSRGVGDVFATLDAMISRISDSKVVMFTPLVHRLSIAIRRNVVTPHVMESLIKSFKL